MVKNTDPPMKATGVHGAAPAGGKPKMLSPAPGGGVTKRIPGGRGPSNNPTGAR